MHSVIFIYYSFIPHRAVQFSDGNSISRYLARLVPALGLYGANMMEQTEVCVFVKMYEYRWDAQKPLAAPLVELIL